MRVRATSVEGTRNQHLGAFVVHFSTFLKGKKALSASSGWNVDIQACDCVMITYLKIAPGSA